MILCLTKNSCIYRNNPQECKTCKRNKYHEVITDKFAKTSDDKCPHCGSPGLVPGWHWCKACGKKV